MKRKLLGLCLSMPLLANAYDPATVGTKAVEQPYFGLHMLGSKAYSTYADPSYHVNAQSAAIEAILPIGNDFGAKLSGGYGVSDVSLPSACGQLALHSVKAQGFWRNPRQGKAGAYVGRKLDGNCVDNNDSYQNYGFIGEYYFVEGWVGASADYLRSDSLPSGRGIDSDNYLLTAEWQPRQLTLAVHLVRSFNTPVVTSPSLISTQTNSANDGDFNITSYVTDNVALNMAVGQMLHVSNNAPRHGDLQLGARWQPEAFNRTVELAATADFTNEFRTFGLRFSYYFDNRSSLIYRDRNLRY